MSQMCARCSYTVAENRSVQANGASGPEAEQNARDRVPNNGRLVQCNSQAVDGGFQGTCQYQVDVPRTGPRECDGRYRASHQGSDAQRTAEANALAAARSALPNGAANIDCNSWQARR